MATIPMASFFRKFRTSLAKIFEDRALRVQFIKIGVLLLLFVIPFAFPSALAKKNAGKQATIGIDKIAPPPKKQAKRKKTQKKEIKERENYLTNEERRNLIHERFEIPPALRTSVEFWKMIYSKYDRRYEIFHDADDLGIIYSVLDLSDLDQNSAWSDQERRAARKLRVDAEKERIRSTLLRFSEGPVDPKKLAPDEFKIYALFQYNPSPEVFKAAAERRIRSQTGIKDKFIKGVEECGAYMEEIEDIFTSYGIPAEITRLVFVESMFNTKVRSKVGASGIWQFMPTTGKLYLNIDGIVDERNDPIRATHAAARLLKANYEALGTWPLAINAYNSGRGTMQNAIRSLGTTDIAEIIMNYQGGVYGFASRNFFPSFLAALEVANQYPKYLGTIKTRKSLLYEEYTLQYPAFFSRLATTAGIDYQDISELNPHFSEMILSDQKPIPRGYAIRIPRGTAEKFSQAELMSANRSSASNTPSNRR